MWELSWRLNKDCNILTPSSFVSSSTSFLFCFELQQLTPNSKLAQTSCGTGLYNCLTSICFCEHRICIQSNPSTVKVIPWYLWPDAPVIYTGAFLIWQLSRVGGQYVTYIYNLNISLITDINSVEFKQATDIQAHLNLRVMSFYLVLFCFILFYHWNIVKVIW